MAQTAAAEVLVEVEGKIGVVSINRPSALNALSISVMDAVSEALGGFDRDPSIHAMVLAGLPKAFAAGADIAEMKDITGGAAAEKQLARHLSNWDRIGNLKKPVVAAVSGFALGGGCELAMACDMIVASETAVFGQPEVLIGVMPGAGGTQRLTKAVGKALSMEMNLTGRKLTAREALSLGLVNRVVPVESFLSEAKKLAHTIAAQPPLAVQAAKASVRESLDSRLSEGLSFERQSFYRLFDTQDQKEGMKAFAEKRKPVWSGK
ncbi:MAG: enoyl-CoA hydratase/isomerase family protein [Elusimicrobia bacterium]|nr:enoyl-CoA hydratase/isomerase family protein [Elusimicrobiota bacterium]